MGLVKSAGLARLAKVARLVKLARSSKPARLVKSARSASLTESSRFGELVELTISMTSIQLAGLAIFDGLALMTSSELAQLTKLAGLVEL